MLKCFAQTFCAKHKSTILQIGYQFESELDAVRLNSCSMRNRRALPHLNYLVPYCVSSYSAAKNEIELKESNECRFTQQN